MRAHVRRKRGNNFICVRPALVAQEVDAVELVSEALAGGERGLEIAFAEHISVRRLWGNDSGIARLAADERNLAKEIARPQTRNLAISANDFDLAIENQEELVSGIALADDRFSGGVVTFRHLFRDVGKLARGQCLEQPDRSEELADPQRIVQDHIRHDAAVDHVHEAVGKSR